MAALAASKTRPAHRLLFALGIPLVGEHVAQLLMEHRSSIWDLERMSIDEIQRIEGIGPEIASSLLAWFSEASNRDCLKALEGVGLQLSAATDERTHHPQTNSLAGKRFVLTGTLPSLTREQASEMIEQAGGRVTSSVSSKTSYVVAGDSPGYKLAKAQKLGVPILDEARLRDLLQEPKT
jgi:DNA ligase (NAD+)